MQKSLGSKTFGKFNKDRAETERRQNTGEYGNMTYTSGFWPKMGKKDMGSTLKTTRHTPFGATGKIDKPENVFNGRFTMTS